MAIDMKRIIFAISWLFFGICNGVSAQKTTNNPISSDEQVRIEDTDEQNNNVPVIKNKLRKLDKVAYIRFASVYKDFKDVKDFKKVIKEV